MKELQGLTGWLLVLFFKVKNPDNRIIINVTLGNKSFEPFSILRNHQFSIIKAVCFTPFQKINDLMYFHKGIVTNIQTTKWPEWFQSINIINYPIRICSFQPALLDFWRIDYSFLSLVPAASENYYEDRDEENATTLFHLSGIKLEQGETSKVKNKLHSSNSILASFSSRILPTTFRI